MPPDKDKPKPFWAFPITSPFGAKDTDVRRGSHRGIDFGVPNGTPITPRTGGTVIRATANDPELGNYVVIMDEDGFLNTYGHLSAITVTKDAEVTPTTVIGRSGSTGKVTGPHLHFAMTNDQGEVVDPTPFFKVTGASATTTPTRPSNPSLFGSDVDPNAPPADDATEETGNWFAQLAAALGYLTKKNQVNPLFPDAQGPGLRTSELFNRPPVSGSGQDIFNNAPSFQGSVGLDEAAQLLPLFDRSMGGRGAFSENVIRALGMNPRIGNPFVTQMQSRVERLSPQVFFDRLLRGESVDQRAIADDIVNHLRSGRRRPVEIEALRQGVRSLPRDPAQMTPQQELLSSILNRDPSMIAEFITAAEDLPPDLARFMPDILQQRQRAALRRTVDVPQASLVDFLLGGGGGS